MRQQAALETQRGGPLPGVPARVVQADGGAGRELLGQRQVLLLERLLAPPPYEHRHAEGGAARHQRDDHQAVEAELRTLGGPGRFLRHPLHDDGVGHPQQGRLTGGQGLDGRRLGEVPVHVTGHGHRLGHAGRDGAVRYAAQYGTVGHRARFVAVEQRFQQVDADEVGEPGDGEVGQFLRGPGDVQRAADAGTGLDEQSEPLGREVLGGDVLDGGAHPGHLPLPPAQHRGGGGEDPAVRGTGRGASPGQEPQDRLTGLDHPAHPLLPGLRVVPEQRGPVHVGGPVDPGHRGTLPHRPQLGVVHGEGHRGTGEEPVQHGGSVQGRGGGPGGEADREQPVHRAGVPLQGVHPHGQPQQPAVLVPHAQLTVEPVLTDVRGGVRREHCGHRLSDHLTRSVSQEPLGPRAPLGDGRTLVDDDQRRVGQVGVASPAAVSIGFVSVHLAVPRSTVTIRAIRIEELYASRRAIRVTQLGTRRLVRTSRGAVEHRCATPASGGGSPGCGGRGDGPGPRTGRRRPVTGRRRY